MFREQLIHTVRCDVRCRFIITKNDFLYYGRSDKAKRTMTSEKTEHLKQYVNWNTEISDTVPIVS